MTRTWVALTAALLSGCCGMSNTDQGVLAGGGLGALAGAAIGSATGNALPGALIGAGVGGVAGGLTGAAVDRAECRANARLAAALPPPAPIGLTDVANLAQQGVSDEVVINQIRTSGSVFYLSPNDLRYLRECGVSDRVVMEMQSSACRGRRVYAPVYGPPPVYVVEPPPVVGVGFSYSR